MLITSPLETPSICPNKISSMFKVVAKLYLFRRIIPTAKKVENTILRLRNNAKGRLDYLFKDFSYGCRTEV